MLGISSRLLLAEGPLLSNSAGLSAVRIFRRFLINELDGNDGEELLSPVEVVDALPVSFASCKSDTSATVLLVRAALARADRPVMISLVLLKSNAGLPLQIGRGY